jgi:hypothetical protein
MHVNKHRTILKITVMFAYNVKECIANSFKVEQ